MEIISVSKSVSYYTVVLLVLCFFINRNVTDSSKNEVISFFFSKYCLSLSYLLSRCIKSSLQGIPLEESAWCSIPFNEENIDSLYMMLITTLVYFLVPMFTVSILYIRLVANHLCIITITNLAWVIIISSCCITFLLYSILIDIN